jgi:hypothetical protein
VIAGCSRNIFRYGAVDSSSVKTSIEVVAKKFVMTGSKLRTNLCVVSTNNLQSDFEREGSKSKGKQPSLLDKVSNCSEVYSFSGNL